MPWNFGRSFESAIGSSAGLKTSEKLLSSHVVLFASELKLKTTNIQMDRKDFIPGPKVYSHLQISDFRPL
jgi:hypothetical protein